MRLRPKHVRTRLTLWYVSVLAALLLLFWAGTFMLLFRQLRAQLDHYAVQDIETIEGLLFFDSAGRLQLKEDYHNHPESKHVLERMLEVRSPEGKILYRNERLGNRVLGGAPSPNEGVGGYSERPARLSDGTRVRMVSRFHNLDGRPILIRLAYSEETLWSRLKEMVAATAIIFPIMLAIAGLAGYALARRALAPLEQMARRAEQITPERLSERLPGDEADDELAYLARVFNKTLDRLERAFDQLRRFTSDASHELRTPLASIRSVGEVGLQKDGSREYYRDIIGSMLEEVNRLTSLVDNLLTISRADAGHIQLRKARVPAMDLAREAGALFEVLLEEKAQRFSIEGEDELAIEGDRLLLRQALVNILHNAVKYSPVKGLIKVRVYRERDRTVAIEVADEGPGIPPEHAAKVFDRFYRVDPSRSREVGGAGLGLSIARWVAEAHGGQITLSNSPGQGATFRISLPSALADLEASGRPVSSSQYAARTGSRA